MVTVYYCKISGYMGEFQRVTCLECPYLVDLLLGEGLGELGHLRLGDVSVLVLVVELEGHLRLVHSLNGTPTTTSIRPVQIMLRINRRFLHRSEYRK